MDPHEIARAYQRDRMEQAHRHRLARQARRSRPPDHTRWWRRTLGRMALLTVGTAVVTVALLVTGMVGATSGSP